MKIQSTVEQSVSAISRKVRQRFPTLEIDVEADERSYNIAAIKKQAGLKFDLEICFGSDDELHIISPGNFDSNFFSIDNARISEEALTAIVGLIAGKYRVVIYRRRGRMVASEIQKPTPEGWARVRWYSQALYPKWLSKMSELVNNEDQAEIE